MTALSWPVDTYGVSLAPLSEDILEGAEEIAEYLFGDRTKRRKVYHLNQAKQIPTFQMGAVICARRSTLLAWIAEQEGASAPLKVEAA